MQWNLPPVSECGPDDWVVGYDRNNNGSLDELVPGFDINGDGTVGNDQERLIRANQLGRV